MFACDRLNLEFGYFNDEDKIKIIKILLDEGADYTFLDKDE